MIQIRNRSAVPGRSWSWTVVEIDRTDRPYDVLNHYKHFATTHCKNDQVKNKKKACRHQGVCGRTWLGWVSRSLLPEKKQIPPHEKSFCCGKKWPKFHVFFSSYFFLGLGWPWVGEFVGFIIVISFPTHHNLVNRMHPNTRIPTKVILDGLKRNMSRGNSLSDELELFCVKLSINNIVGLVHENHTWYYTNSSDVPRSLQSWVPTIQTVVFTADVFQLFIKRLPGAW